MSSKMLTSSEAEITRGIFGAEEPLCLSLLLRPCAVTIYTCIVVRSIFAIGITHFHIIRVPRLGRILRISSVECFIGGLLEGRGRYGRWKRRCRWQRALTGERAKVGPGRSCCIVSHHLLHLCSWCRVGSWSERICFFTSAPMALQHQSGIYWSKGGHRGYEVCLFRLRIDDEGAGNVEAEGDDSRRSDEVGRKD